MSRHTIVANEPKRYEVVVGWDHPLLTYFCIVYDNRKRATDDDVVHWRGTSLRELYEIEDLRRALKGYAEIDAETGATLYGDKDEGR